MGTIFNSPCSILIQIFKKAPLTKRWSFFMQYCCYLHLVFRVDFYPTLTKALMRENRLQLVQLQKWTLMAADYWRKK